MGTNQALFSRLSLRSGLTVMNRYFFSPSNVRLVPLGRACFSSRVDEEVGR